MAVFKCKMCGGSLDISDGITRGKCPYCGTTQTLPRLDDERRVNLYDRANHFRRNNDFDKAAGIYEQILNEDNTDAEAYWSLVLCRFGIEYVEDPATHRRVPTVNRAQYTSIFDDDNYKSALSHAADTYQRGIYEEEAKSINEIQKGILEISQKEEPFDVFICYKETDNNGRRTQDSVLATDLYHQLTQEGFKVFFSRITLEDKLGQEYEPYIFAALNSAKVMVVLGTRRDHFDAVWVKNEWSRYLSLVKNSAGKKILIPAYKDMDPYDLPEEFSHLQAQDMSKLGFMQDLIRGIKKILEADEPNSVQKEVVLNQNVGVEPLLKRAFMFLEDGNWEKADEYCERVLDQDPENPRAYLGKLMSELKVHRQENLSDCEMEFNENDNYKKAIRFGDERFSSVLGGYVHHIIERNNTSYYNSAVAQMNEAEDESDYEEAAKAFERIPGFKDADALANRCREFAKEKAKIASNNKLEDLRKERQIRKAEKFKQMSSAVYVSILKRRIEVVTSEETRLSEQFENLGRFHTKEKRQIEEELLNTKAAKSRLKSYIANKPSDTKLTYGYEEAVDIYLNDSDIARKVNNLYPVASLIAAMNNKTDDVCFGNYNNESISWHVLSREQGRMLLISEKALDCKKYNEQPSFGSSDTTWEKCTLRKWLNYEFLTNAFSADEQMMIPVVCVNADKNPECSTSPGRNTMDKIFLLSILELNKYLSEERQRECKPTSYAEEKGVERSYTSRACAWWLRTPGYNLSQAAYVSSSGKVYTKYVSIDDKPCGVRPALWIDLG